VEATGYRRLTANVRLVRRWRFAKRCSGEANSGRFLGKEKERSRTVMRPIPGGNIVAVMGTIMNNSPIPWKDIRFQVEFQDATGRRSDTGQKEDYCYYLPANSSLSFKTSLRRQFPETNYISHTISVVSARDGRARW